MTPPLSARLDGLDVARFAAFVGMVIVNFRIAMGAEETASGPLAVLVSTLEGRAAATFVVLAGIGLGLGARREGSHATLPVTLRRAVFLLAVGLLNTLIFDADILHYYAVYFFLAVFCVAAPNRGLIGLIAAVNVIFMVMLATLTYDAGWDWTTYTYADFWTPLGFVRNLFFNGWHPVFPWFGFLLFGILLSRLRLSDARIQRRLIVLGAAALALAETVSAGLRVWAAGDPALLEVITTGPIPPTPLYTVAGTGAAALVIGLCLLGAPRLARLGVVAVLAPAGRQTLTLYIAHILIGMGTLEALGLLGGQPLPVALGAAAAFCALSVVYALAWSRWIGRGPVEAVMRRLAG
ncbi:DUF418 domain-containing protein [Roseospira visakhapatnamensis]|uniref:Putative membrane protein YeiB n=1 Tax=Roseospira visakhapatnamensis TaxID=390880 RepID=A0A7W6RBD6_9PROT|nr:heparan-alpha-glucosaminide N-acetyltransferase domain-containing protein [Roseospira visakhapatnamensis]MBB4265421.1 putative membrane protein YeiB [Roseospira visakhapatnamensis]